MRDIPIRLLDLSLSGCLLGAARDVAQGIGGELRVALDGVQYHDVVRVVRHHGRHGASFTCLLGGQFVSARRSGVASVREVVPGDAMPCTELVPPA